MVNASVIFCPTVCGGDPAGRLIWLSGVESPDEDGSTVDVQDFAGNEGREFGSKEEHRAGELLGPANPAQRNRRDDLLPAIGFAQAGRDMSVSNQPGAMQLTRMWSAASSGASDLVRLMTAPLLAA